MDSGKPLNWLLNKRVELGSASSALVGEKVLYILLLQDCLERRAKESPYLLARSYL